MSFKPSQVNLTPKAASVVMRLAMADLRRVREDLKLCIGYQSVPVIAF